MTYGCHKIVYISLIDSYYYKLHKSNHVHIGISTTIDQYGQRLTLPISGVIGKHGLNDKVTGNTSYIGKKTCLVQRCPAGKIYQ